MYSGRDGLKCNQLFVGTEVEKLTLGELAQLQKEIRDLAREIGQVKTAMKYELPSNYTEARTSRNTIYPAGNSSPSKSNKRTFNSDGQPLALGGSGADRRGFN